MGTFGAGTFDNDAAGNFVYEIAAQIRREISYEDADVEDLSVMLAGVAMLSVLCEHCHGPAPSRATVRQWRQAHLSIFEADFDALQPVPGHKDGPRGHRAGV